MKGESPSTEHHAPNVRYFKRRPSKSAIWSPPVGFPEEATYIVKQVLVDPKREVIVIPPVSDSELLNQSLQAQSLVAIFTLTYKTARDTRLNPLSYAKPEFGWLNEELNSRKVPMKELWGKLSSAVRWYSWTLFFLVIGEVRKRVRRKQLNFLLAMAGPGKCLGRRDKTHQPLYQDWLDVIDEVKRALGNQDMKLPGTLVSLARWDGIAARGKRILESNLGKETLAGQLRVSKNKEPLLHTLPFWNKVIVDLVNFFREKGFKGEKPFELTGWTLHLFFPSFWPATVLLWKQRQLHSEDIEKPSQVRAAFTPIIKQRYYDHS